MCRLCFRANDHRLGELLMKKFLQIFFSCILSLFLAILALGAGLCHYAQKTVCQPNLLISAGIESNYSQQVYDEIAYEWENLLAITGVETPEDIMAVLTPELVAKDAMGYINDSYTGSAELNTDQLRSDLDARVREYAYSHNIHATPEAELEQNIKDLVDACIVEYESAITIPLLPQILGAVGRYSDLLPKCLIALVAGCIIILLFLFFLQRKKQETLYYAAISAITAGIFLFGIPVLSTHYDVLNRLPLGESALKTLVVKYMQVLLNTLERYGKLFLAAAAITLLLFILIEFIVAIMKNNQKVKAENIDPDA